MRNAGLAQLGEHHVYTVEVGGSSPSARTRPAVGQVITAVETTSCVNTLYRTGLRDDFDGEMDSCFLTPIVQQKRK